MSPRNLLGNLLIYFKQSETFFSCSTNVSILALKFPTSFDTSVFISIFNEITAQYILNA